MRRERALVLIIAYKVVRAVLWLVAAATLMVLMPLGLSEHLLGLARHLRHHTGAWSLRLADLVVQAATRRGLWVIVVALLADSAVSGLEAFALLRGHWWGPWLVVVTTSSFVPFEIAALVKRPDIARAAVLSVNVAIALYLARKAMRDRAAH
jgi:uncharacterized membrane protein (DUF2068 family)